MVAVLCNGRASVSPVPRGPHRFLTHTLEILCWPLVRIKGPVILFREC